MKKKHAYSLWISRFPARNKPTACVNVLRATLRHQEASGVVNTRVMTINQSAIARELTDIMIAEQRGAARGVIAARLEELYAYARSYMGEDADGKPDVRFAELMLRILDRMIKVHRIDERDLPGQEEPEQQSVATDRMRVQIAAQMADLASRSVT